MTYVRQTRPGKGKRVILLSMGGLFLIILLTMYFYISGHKSEKVLGNSDFDPINQSTLNVVRASRSIQAGEMADAVKFEIAAVPKELLPAGAVDSIFQLKNKRVANQLAEGEFLLQSDLVESGEWYEEEDRLIEHTFQDGAIPATVEVGSVVDIKLFRPRQEDEIVVAKTVVIGKVDKTLSFYLNKSEQEYIKEANTEGLIFLVQYLDKSQAASIVSYMPKYDEKSAGSSTGEKQSFADSNMKKE